MEFDWDMVKAESNLEKHGVDIAEPMTIFRDPLEITFPDPDHSEGESRFLSLGCSNRADYWSRHIPHERGGFVSSVAGRPPEGSGDSMNRNPAGDDEITAEYDFSVGVRGKHHTQYEAGTNVVFLDADIAGVFRHSESDNRALRLLLDVAGCQTPPDGAA